MLRHFLLSTFVIGLSGSACHKNHNPSRQLYTGKLVIASPCSHYVIEVVEGPIDPAKIAVFWKDTFADTTYKNVFTVSNYCSFADLGLGKNEYITFELATETPPPGCQVQCMIYYPTPPVQNLIKNAKKVTWTD